MSETDGGGPAPLIDTHCHLTLLEERGLLAAALEGAEAAGVQHIVTVGENLEDSERNRAIAEATPGVVFGVGWHPHERSAPAREQVRALARLLDHPLAVAVGEVGLDRFFRPGYHEVPLAVQQQSFRVMLELAAERRKPVLVHDRDAHDEVLAAIARVPGTTGVMHCFSGDRVHAERCVAAGFVLSFSGIVTFPRSEAVQDAAAWCPADAYVLETDAPFLAPVPHRGTVNVPARVADTAAAVARLRGESVERVREQTSRTARRLLSLGAGLGELGAAR